MGRLDETSEPELLESVLAPIDTISIRLAEGVAYQNADVQAEVEAYCQEHPAELDVLLHAITLAKARYAGSLLHAKLNNMSLRPLMLVIGRGGLNDTSESLAFRDIIQNARGLPLEMEQEAIGIFVRYER